MIVREVLDELFEETKRDGEGSVFSYILGSKLDPRYLEKHFFRGKFLTWSVFEKSPYCRLTEDLGPISEDTYIKVVMLNEGITQDMYP